MFSLAETTRTSGGGSVMVLSSFKTIEAADAGHLHVENHEGGTQGADRDYPFRAVDGGRGLEFSDDEMMSSRMPRTFSSSSMMRTSFPRSAGPG